MNAIKCNRLDDIKAATVEYKVIAIDEGQFVSYILLSKPHKIFSFLTLSNFVKILLIVERLLLLLPSMERISEE